MRFVSIEIDLAYRRLHILNDRVAVVSENPKKVNTVKHSLFFCISSRFRCTFLVASIILICLICALLNSGLLTGTEAEVDEANVALADLLSFFCELLA